MLFIALFVETEIHLYVTYGLVWLPALEQDTLSFSLVSTLLETRWLFEPILSCYSLNVAVLVIVCLFFVVCLIACFFFNLVQLLYDLKTDWSIEGFFFLVFCLFVCFHVFYVLVLRYSFCLLWFLSLSVFRIVISANTICQANNYIFTDYLFLAGCLCSCGSSYAVFPDGQFLLDACRGDLYLLICCKGLQHYR